MNKESKYPETAHEIGVYLSWQDGAQNTYVFDIKTKDPGPALKAIAFRAGKRYIKNLLGENWDLNLISFSITID